MGPGESRRRPERCQIAGGRPLDLELFVRRVGLQLGAVHRHRQHAVIADAGRQLDVFVRAEAVHHRFRQAVFDPVVAQQLAGEVDDLEVFRRDAVRMFVADGVEPLAKHPLARVLLRRHANGRWRCSSAITPWMPQTYCAWKCRPTTSAARVRVRSSRVPSQRIMVPRWATRSAHSGACIRRPTETPAVMFGRLLYGCRRSSPPRSARRARCAPPFFAFHAARRVVLKTPDAVIDVSTRAMAVRVDLSCRTDPSRYGFSGLDLVCRTLLDGARLQFRLRASSFVSRGRCSRHPIARRRGDGRGIETTASKWFLDRVTRRRRGAAVELDRSCRSAKSRAIAHRPAPNGRRGRLPYSGGPPLHSTAWREVVRIASTVVREVRRAGGWRPAMKSRETTVQEVLRADIAPLARVPPFDDIDEADCAGTDRPSPPRRCARRWNSSMKVMPSIRLQDAALADEHVDRMGVVDVLVAGAELGDVRDDVGARRRTCRSERRRPRPSV